MYNEFINYMTKHIDFEEMKVVDYITRSEIFAIIISLQVENIMHHYFRHIKKK